MLVSFIDGELTGTINKSGRKVRGPWALWGGCKSHVLLGVGGSPIVKRQTRADGVPRSIPYY